MAYVAADKDGSECTFDEKPVRDGEIWEYKYLAWDSKGGVYLPKGSIEKLIGHKLTWEDEPVELKIQEKNEDGLIEIPKMTEQSKKEYNARKN